MIKTFINKLLFRSVTDLVHLGGLRPLEAQDFPELPLDLKVANARSAMAELKNKSAMGLLWHSIKREKSKFIWATLAYFAASAAVVGTPWVLNRFSTLLSQLNTSQSDISSLIFWAFALGLVSIGSGLLIQHYYYQYLLMFQKLVNFINLSLIEKTLSLQESERDKTATGDLINHLNSDTDSIANFHAVVIEFVSNSLIIIAVFLSLFYFIGSAAYWSLAFILTNIPLSIWLAKKHLSLDKALMEKRDHRVSLMSQVIGAIKLIKYLGWEKKISEEVHALRQNELLSRYQITRLDLASSVIYLSSSSLSLLIGLYIFHLQGGDFNLTLLVTCLALVSAAEEPMGNFSRLISMGSSARVSAKRVTQFLSLNEQKQLEKNALDENILSLKNCSFSKDNLTLLKDISIQIKAGQRVALVGPVGSGKSVLLKAILGELDLTQGEAHLKTDSISYSPQDPFIMNSDVRANVQFGRTKTTDEDIFKSLALCELKEELGEHSSALDLEIGEKGVNLSGGQKQRLSLARCHFANTKLIALDDPISALDPTTGELLFKNLILEEWKNRTVIMATHRLQLLKQFDLVVFIENGQIEAQGSFEFLLNHSSRFKRFFDFSKELESHSKPAHQENAKTSQITDLEDREVGKVESSEYLNYLRYLGGGGKATYWVLGLLLFLAVNQVIWPMISQGWMTKGFELQKQNEFFTVTLFLGGFAGLIAITFIANAISEYYWFNRGVKAGTLFHDRMLDSVVHAPVRQFEKNPAGRILQRFSRDVESVDIQLQWSFENSAKAFLRIAISFATVIAVVPVSLVLIGPTVWYYYVIQKQYRQSAREAKRLDSISRSPRFAHYKEVLNGLISLRAFNRKDWVTEEFRKILDFHQKMFRGHYLINRWFSAQLPVVGGLIGLATSLSLILSVHKGWITTGTGQLVLLVTLSFWGVLNWAVRIFAEVEAKMTSVERINSYIEWPTERDESARDNKLIVSNGVLEFKRVSARYRPELPLVLSDVSFTTKPGLKTGIVGRTGSGKSSLTQVVFRMLAVDSGSVLIDSQNIKEVDLNSLRTQLSIIPQDPTLFLGTVRSNLDRFSLYTDYQLIEALEEVGLWSYFSKSGGLQSQLKENGTNLSQGQRQLVCLARAFLLNSKILILDEATASVDVESDDLIQKALNRKAKNLNLMIVAHRLETLQDCDQIIELSNGKAKLHRNLNEYLRTSVEQMA